MRRDSWHRIGHGGASGLLPGNTLASFELAREIGIDMVEFDVRAWRGELVLAHTVLHARRGDSVRLQDALAHLAGRRFAEIGVNIDLKHTGCEPALLHWLRSSGLLSRALISCQVPAALERVKALEPRARVGISIGGRLARLSRRWHHWRSTVLAGLAAGRWDALMAQHRLVDAGLVAEVRERDRLLFAWTVNDRSLISRLRRLGVDGVATADPRLFVEQ
ncbi:MAG: glycerophosphodiester phosphodiesterase [Solirubrobacterales bacterium]|nr:glycerophosphodiester phosphodiesterase [Solirubrobacterales bacterium]